MSNRFIKLIDSTELDWLLANHTGAYVLLTYIAKHARWKAGHADGLLPGMCIIGDPKTFGSTRQKTRTNLKFLEKQTYIKILDSHKTPTSATIKLTNGLTIKPTFKGTLVQICDNRIFDLNILTATIESTINITVKETLEQPSSNHQAIPKSFAEALQLAANQAAELEAARPAIEFVGRYVESTGDMGFRQVAKLLKIKENDFRAFLQDSRIMYRLGTEWTPYEPHIKAGRFHVSTGTS